MTSPFDARTIEITNDLDRAMFVALTRMGADELEVLLQSDPARAFRCVQAAAACGLVQAQLRLGRMLLEGKGAPRDDNAAFTWFRRAAESGEANAENMVGRCYENGWGQAVDSEEAVTWYRRAADQGHAWAQYNLGHMYLDGNGVAQDRDLAQQWYRRAAEQGHARAMNLLGRCYEEGWGVVPDTEAARLWYTRSAEGGYFRGQYNVATLLFNDGRVEDALRWFARALATATEPSREHMRTALRNSRDPRVRKLGLR